ncbi:ATP-binding protein [Bosea sp. NBC_00550]|uniref:ATP-binding protein n=1 Tax=Bosea sp. NBC_00550 TaxID=2969621 RepID=UPI002231606D|nr:helix-turn-helix transcriptional regulator [Bosea sp. NBC_00550]UZF95490.1 helix-turn-helix transcriptional regulator [Bosea sp. NBC_00550]
MDQASLPARLPGGVGLAFGEFCLHPDQHRLFQHNEPVQVGSRALEILIALTERVGEVVTKDELLARAWPNATVEESNLRAQVALLRRILGDNQAAAHYIAAVPGRGYRFVAPVLYSDLNIKAELVGAQSNLPRQLTQVIGREQAIKAVRGRFQRSRLTTVVGPGGIGKTTLCLAIAEQLLSSYEHGVCFLDLAPLANAQLVPSVLAAALGLADGTSDPLPGVITYLRERRMLLIFDSCELVLDASARLAETLLKKAPELHILATSREALRAEGESVYRLAPLEMPAASAGLTAADALTFPAVQLFVDRATSLGSGFELDDNEAPVVADICRQLDGIALAIELAAGRVEAFGTRGIAELLDDRFRLLTGGRRTALPRHQTLAATLDWSYEALSAPEQAVLRRLAVFAGEFTLEAVNAIMSGAGDLATDIRNHLANLIAKSLVAAEAHGEVARYRLLDTTRAYALAKLSERSELGCAMRRVADYLCAVLKHAHGEVDTLPGDEWLGRYGRHINNVRMVLDWTYSTQGDSEVGLAVTVAAIPLWYQLSSVDECLSGVQRALSGLGPGAVRDAQARQVMQLYRALGLSQAFKVGFAPQAPAAFAKALEIAEDLADGEAQLEALWGLWLCQVGMGEYRASLELAQRFMTLAESSLDRFIGDRMLSMTLFSMGDCRGARNHADRMLAHDVSAAGSSPASSVRFRFGQSVTARVQPAQLLWMQGFPDQAVEAVHHAIDAARETGHAISLCDALSRWGCPVWVHVGDLAAADLAITTLLDQAATNALGPWEVFGRCWKGTLLIKQGLLDRGIPLLRTALGELQQGRLFTLYNIRFSGFLAEALALSGQVDEARSLVEAAILRSEEKEELWCVAELLRVKGEILLQEGVGAALVEPCFLESIKRAQQQDALSWELRASMSFARFLRGRGEIVQAHRSLATVYSRFGEGFETADLRAAKALLAELS